jgi:NADPH:quinone reductase-like Zn-dependent oxidoreductase
VKAAVLHGFGQVPVVEECDEPEAGDGEEVLDVIAAGINPVDLAIASGGFYGPRPQLPAPVGSEAVVRGSDGHLSYLAKAVSGTLAERVVVRTDSLIALPEGIPPGQAVAAGLAGLAAWGSLQHGAGLRSGESVLVLGASGAVGQIAIQAARLLGACRVVGAARSEEGLERVAELSVDATVALDGGADLGARLSAAADDGFDVCIDLVYGPPLLASLGAMAPLGRIVQVGSAAAPDVTLPAAALRARNLLLTGYTSARLSPEQRAATYLAVAGAFAAGSVAIEIEEIPLDNAAEAWSRQAGSPHRKLVVVP